MIIFGSFVCKEKPHPTYIIVKDCALYLMFQSNFLRLNGLPFSCIQVCKSDNITRNHLPIKRKIFYPSSFPCNSNLSLYIPFIPIIRLLHKRLNSTYIFSVHFHNKIISSQRQGFFYTGNIYIKKTGLKLFVWKWWIGIFFFPINPLFC